MARLTSRNLGELEERFAPDSLNESLIQELHEMIKPYILRRIKADVLKLPPKVSQNRYVLRRRTL
jgi:SNF2 family DNA or RNA helicase